MQNATLFSKILSRRHSAYSIKRLNSILVICDHTAGALKESNLNVLKAINSSNIPEKSSVDFAILAQNTSNLSKEAAKLTGIDRVVECEANEFENFMPEVFTQSISNLIKLQKSYKYIFAPGTTFGKEILPRLSGILNTSMVSEIIGFGNSPNVYRRMMYAGNIIQTVQNNEKLQIISVRCSSFAANKTEQTNGNCTKKLKIDPKKLLDDQCRTYQEKSKHIALKIAKSERPDLATAKLVVSGGRAYNSKEEFSQVFELADALGAAVGASRAVVDAGICSNDMQVGQTGKIISPDLYLSVGVSGAVQHIAGMKDSRFIMAINKDEDAPIFEFADIGLVGDAKKMIPELIKMINDSKK